MTDSASPSTAPLPPMKPWQQFIWCLILLACLFGLACVLFSCVTVKGEDGQPKLVPGVGGGGDAAAAIAPFLPPPWGSILTGLAGVVAVPAAGALGSPRVRKALKKGRLREAVGWTHQNPPPPGATA